MNTEAILKEERQSRAPGKYQITNYYDESIPYSYTPGNNNSTSGINPQKVSDDSFLRNLHIKSNKTILGNENYMLQKPGTIEYVGGTPTNDTRNRKSLNVKVNEKDYFLGGFRYNSSMDGVLNYPTRIGIDSRHIKR